MKYLKLKIFLLEKNQVNFEVFLNIINNLFFLFLNIQN